MNSADDLISRHLDGANTGAETEELSALIASDPQAARALVRAARLDGMLQRRFPRQPSRAPLRWTLAAAAAAVIAGSVLAMRMLAPSTLPQPAAATEEENWLPVEKIDCLPIREINPEARAKWEFWHDAREEAPVPLPELKLSWEKKDGELKVVASAVYEHEWGLKRREARIVEMRPDGLIDLGDGFHIQFQSFALLVPDFAAYQAGKNPMPLKPAVFSGLAGELLTGDGKDVRHGGGALQFAGTGSRLMMKLQQVSGKSIAVLGMDVFQPETGIRLTGGFGGSSLTGKDLRVGAEALLTSRAPVIIALEVGLPAQDPMVLPLKVGAAAIEGSAEAHIVGIQPGAWRYTVLPQIVRSATNSCSTHGSFRADESVNSPDQVCLIGLNLSPGLPVKITARTASAAFPSTLRPDIDESLIRFASFDAPAASIKFIEVQPLVRRRVFIRYTPPVDPWEGIYHEAEDVLDIRIPLAAPDVWPCTIIERLTGSAERDLALMVSGLRISITSELRNASIREILAHYARSAGKGRLEMEPRLRKFRFVPN